MAYRDMEVRRRKDRERVARRTAARVAAGLCPRCGKTEPLPERRFCAGCAEKGNRASRARDARLRAAGLPRRDPDKARAFQRKHARRLAAERRAAGRCVRCGKAPAAPERTACEGCLEKRRAADRARYAAGKAAGKLYGGANAAAKRRAARAKSKRCQKARREAGLCIRCGKRPPVEGGTTCAPCREKRQAAEKRQYDRRRAAGCCTRCGGPVHGGRSRCARCAAIEDAGKCPERKNAAARKRYAARRARSACTDCGAPAFGACRCPACAKRSYENSAHVRGMPVYAPTITVYLRGTEKCLGVFDDEMEAAAWLAFEKLSAEGVEMVREASPLAAMAAWE